MAVAGQNRPVADAAQFGPNQSFSGKPESSATRPSTSGLFEMNAAQFVGNWNDLKSELVKAFMGDSGNAEVADEIKAMGLSVEQHD